MLESQWKIFSAFKKEFKEKCIEWNKFEKELVPLQKESALADTPDYQFENAVVYNTALDELTPDSEIKLIVIGDNPGKSEQLNINQKYLVGQAGKLAEGFFKKNPKLKIDFRKNVIILNKTPVHSAKTKHLLQIEKSLRLKNSPASDLIRDSQIWMAQKTAELHAGLFNAATAAYAGQSKSAFAAYTGQLQLPFLPELWLVGYSELKPRGLFIPYRDTLARTYADQLNSVSATYTDQPKSASSTYADQPKSTSSSYADQPKSTSSSYTDQPKSASSTYADQPKSAKISSDPWSRVFVYQHFSMNCFNKDIANYHAASPEIPLKEALEKLGTIHREEIFPILS